MRFGANSCAFLRKGILGEFRRISFATRFLGAILDGYPAWIRTMNNASKGRCVTVTPRGIAVRQRSGAKWPGAYESLERKSELANPAAAWRPFRPEPNAATFPVQ